MKNFKAGVLALMGGLLSQAAWGQQPTFLVPGLHPALKIQNMRPVNASLFSNDAVKGMPNVASWAWQPNGNLFVATMDDSEHNELWDGSGATNINIGGPSKGLLFTGLSTARDSSGVSASVVATGFHMPLSSIYANGTIYVVDDSAGLLQLMDNGNGTYTKHVVYSGLLGSLSGKPGSADRRQDGGLLYKGGYFYAAVGMGFPQGGISDTLVTDIYRGRGTVLKISTDGSVVDTFAGGFRVPVSMAWGPDSQMFMTDNQGSWRPEGCLFNIRQGRFYGHPFTPFDNTPVYPPAIVFPYGTSTSPSTVSDPFVSGVPTDILWLKSGPYAGQLLIGENHASGIHRVFLEKINGEYQGALFPFSQGLGVGAATGSSGALKGVNPNFTASVNRLSYGPDGNIYIGGGSGKGSNGAGSWGFQGSNMWGLARLTWKDTAVFEMKAVRSKSSTTMEIEFTEPVIAAAASNFTVRQFEDIAGGTGDLTGHGNNGYGVGQDVENTVLQVNSATLDSTRTKVTLSITGLKQRSQSMNPSRGWGYVTQIQVNGVTAVSGRAIWGGGNQGGGVAWYTTNVFGPGADVAPPAPIALRNGDGSSGLRFAWRGDALVIQSPVRSPYILRVLDAGGRISATFNVSGGGQLLVPVSALGHGLRWVEARTTTGQRWISRVALP